MADARNKQAPMLNEVFVNVECVQNRQMASKPPVKTKAIRKSEPKVQAGPSQRGIQSIEVGGQLLLALAHHGRALALKDLAADAGMSAAKAHPYLVSFGKLGLIEQDPVSGRYGLGPLAMQLGLISLQQLDPLALATPLIETLALECGHTLAVAVWGHRGATIVRVAQPPSAVHVSMRHGTVMSLRGTASGLLFAALLPPSQVLPVLRSENKFEQRSTVSQVAHSGKNSSNDSSNDGSKSSSKSSGSNGKKASGLDTELASALALVRRDGYSRVKDLLPGISAIAVPVWDGSGALVLSLTAIGPTPGFDARPQSALVRRVRAAASALSARLGWRGVQPKPNIS
jgi:DNA-binding IclR family transcriptional regulator